MARTTPSSCAPRSSTAARDVPTGRNGERAAATSTATAAAPKPIGAARATHDSATCLDDRPRARSARRSDHSLRTWRDSAWPTKTSPARAVTTANAAAARDS